MSEKSVMEPAKTRSEDFRPRLRSAIGRRMMRWGMRIRGLAPIERQVDQVFHAVLGRAPEPEALTAYSKEIAGGRMDFGRTAEALARLAEVNARAAVQRPPPLQTPPQSEPQPHDPEDIRLAVRLAYQVALGRKADRQGVEAFTRELVEGRATLSDVFDELSTSEEALNLCSDNRPVSVAIPVPNMEVIVASLYLSILGREAEAGGLEQYVAALLAGHTTLSDVIDNMVTSDEFAASVLRRPAVARAVVITTLRALTKSEPGTAMVSRYTAALISGYPLDAFLSEFIRERPSEPIAERRNAAGSGSSPSPVERESGGLVLPTQAGMVVKMLDVPDDASGDCLVSSQAKSDDLEAPLENFLSDDVCEKVVTRLFLALLGREIDLSTRKSLSQKLCQGTETIFSITNKILNSEEFEAVGLKHYRVSRIVANYVLNALTGLQPDDVAIEIVARRLRQQASPPNNTHL